MSFGTDVRKVRDPSLPYGRRINALAQCVGQYAPIGFQATFGYLGQVAGRFHHEEAALLRAVGALDASRRLWLAEMRAYAVRRTEAKRRGHRIPHPRDGLPRGDVWYGDRSAAARFALGYVLRRTAAGRPVRGRDADPDVLALASAVLDGDTRWERASDLRRRFGQVRRDTRAADDWSGWSRAGASLWVLHLIAEASRPPG
ncbi:hypothetical protein [Actinoplanes utahensis]|uniref:hypothetical protein n=1 Tax=Actinoplanes utahensis TaxID=1869 RepID=UPI000B248826|nr:hypothetical protein [Actinoplanes utahensis]GIF32957.1 hypothetical protein Aut01nite_59430 [Actinoplanes utahensis]